MALEEPKKDIHSSGKCCWILENLNYLIAVCRRGEIKDQEIKRSRDQELYQGVGNRKIYSYFGEALKGGRWYSSVKYMRETLEQIYIHLN